jgi:hypothetical protein
VPETDTKATSGAIAAIAGVALSLLGFWALASIPRTPYEFTYLNPVGGTAFWPLPFAPINGFTPEQLSSHVARLLFLLPACVSLGIAFARVTISRRSPPTAVIIPLAGVAITAVIGLLVIRSVPLQDDDATYLMQADFLARGTIADASHPLSVTFPEPFTVFSRSGLTGMYLFGTPLVLALGRPLHLPWLGPLALVGLTVYAAHKAAARAGDVTVAWIGAGLLAVSPMLTFTSATPISQPAVLAGLALAILGLATGRWTGGILVGSGLGFALAARPQIAVPAGAVLVLLYAWKDRRLLAGMLLAALPWIVAVALYDHAITGSFLQLPRNAYTGELEKFGFGVVLRHYNHTPLRALALVGVTLVRLNGWALGWPLSLAGPLLWIAQGRPHRGIVGPWASVALATFVIQAGYASIGTSETGPIYHFTALPFIAFSTAAALRGAAGRSWGRWTQAAALASLVIGTTSFYVEHGLRLSRLTHAIEGPRRSLTLETPSLLFEDVWGNRPQYGWVFGIPFRDRSDTAPVVRYPRPPKHQELSALVARWHDRRCAYLWFDARAWTYRVNPCEEIDAVDRARGNVENPTAVGAEVNGQPWFANGGWKKAFPYLPLTR